MLIDTDWCLLMLINADWCWLMSIDADWSWLMLIDAIEWHKSECTHVPWTFIFEIIVLSYTVYVVDGLTKVWSCNPLQTVLVGELVARKICWTRLALPCWQLLLKLWCWNRSERRHWKLETIFSLWVRACPDLWTLPWLPSHLAHFQLSLEARAACAGPRADPRLSRAGIAVRARQVLQHHAVVRGSRHLRPRRWVSTWKDSPGFLFPLWHPFQVPKMLPPHTPHTPTFGTQYSPSPCDPLANSR